MFIGNKIREYREQKNWCQAGLARRAGLSQQSISLIESGVVSPRAQSLERIAFALNVSVGDIYADKKGERWIQDRQGSR
ncbi:MAG: hypothetical protein DRH04_02540 [Deltaproteobacteria bacterium]|nr:MAG: hypothetical protein DRH04_02540 [Deltaproteobacteria bacterium]